MPDTKLNWSNLREHFRKHLIIYVVVMAAALLVTNFLWLATSPRLPEEARVLIYMVAPYSNAEALDGEAADLLQRGQAMDPALQSVEFQSLLFPDPAQDYTGVMLLMTRLAAGEGDAFLADENGLNALAGSRACLGLEEYVAAGWLNGLEPVYHTYEDPETGASETKLIALRIDTLNALREREIMENEGSYLAVAANGTNIETTMKLLELLVKDLSGGAA